MFVDQTQVKWHAGSVNLDIHPSINAQKAENCIDVRETIVMK